jgi:hypothetical protein
MRLVNGFANLFLRIGTHRMHTPEADEYDPAGQREHFESGRRHAPDLLK